MCVEVGGGGGHPETLLLVTIKCIFDIDNDHINVFMWNVINFNNFII